MPSYAEWVSTAALGLSVFSIGWQVKRSTDEQPRLMAASHGGVMFGHKDEGVVHSFSVTVTNLGKSPITISDVGWEREDEDGWYSLGRRMKEERLQGHGKVDGPPLPHRIEGMDQVTWTSDESAMAMHQGDRVRAVAHTIHRGPSFWQKATSFVTRKPWEEDSIVRGGWIRVPVFGKTLREYFEEEGIPFDE